MQTIYQSLPQTLSQFEWIAALLARAAVGLLFLLSGSGKLFTPEKRKSMRETMEEAGVPMPRFNAVFVAFLELLFGGLLLVGFLTPAACLILICIMLVAVATVQSPKWQGSLTGWLGEFLYLPEVMYVVILLWLLLAGPGWLSVDHAIRRQMASG